MRRAIITVTATAVLVLVPAVTAAAHECFIADRSTQGSVAATHSSRWFTFSLEEIFAGFLGVPAANVDDAVADAIAAGVPEIFAVRSDKTIGEGSNGRVGDGKGLEHLEESPIAATVIEIAIRYGGHL